MNTGRTNTTVTVRCA